MQHDTIYEFYCDKCDTIFGFLSRTINTSKLPNCPRCGKRRIEKMVSSFSATSGAKGGDAGDGPALDEAKIEGAMESLSREAEGLGDDDPRQAAALMRKMSKMTGMKLGEGMESALTRLESGEDPEQMEAELGDLIEKEEPFDVAGQEGKKRSVAPQRDTLYEM